MDYGQKREAGLHFCENRAPKIFFGNSSAELLSPFRLTAQWRRSKQNFCRRFGKPAIGVRPNLFKSSAELVFIYKPPAKAVRLLFSLLARCFCWSVADCRVAAGLLLIAALLLVELIGELLLCAGRADCHRPPSLRSGMFRKLQTQNKSCMFYKLQTKKILYVL